MLLSTEKLILTVGLQSVLCFPIKSLLWKAFASERMWLSPATLTQTSVSLMKTSTFSGKKMINLSWRFSAGRWATVQVSKVTASLRRASIKMEICPWPSPRSSSLTEGYIAVDTDTRNRVNPKPSISGSVVSVSFGKEKKRRENALASLKSRRAGEHAALHWLCELCSIWRLCHTTMINDAMSVHLYEL